jgi:hypothetical protein
VGAGRILAKLDAYSPNRAISDLCLKSEFENSLCLFALLPHILLVKNAKYLAFQ